MEKIKSPSKVNSSESNGGENTNARESRGKTRRGERSSDVSTSPEVDSATRRMSSRQRKPSWRVGFDPADLLEKKKSVHGDGSKDKEGKTTLVEKIPTPLSSPAPKRGRGRGRPAKITTAPSPLASAPSPPAPALGPPILTREVLEQGEDSTSNCSSGKDGLSEKEAPEVPPNIVEEADEAEELNEPISALVNLNEEEEEEEDEEVAAKEKEEVEVVVAKEKEKEEEEEVAAKEEEEEQLQKEIEIATEAEVVPKVEKVEKEAPEKAKPPPPELTPIQPQPPTSLLQAVAPTNQENTSNPSPKKIAPPRMAARKRRSVPSKSNDEYTTFPMKRTFRGNQYTKAPSSPETVILKKDVEINYDYLDLGYGSKFEKKTPSNGESTSTTSNTIKKEEKQADGEEEMDEEYSKDLEESNLGQSHSISAKKLRKKRDEDFFVLKHDFQPCSCKETVFNGHEVGVEKKKGDAKFTFCQAIDQMGDKKIGCCRLIDLANKDLRLYRVASRCHFKLFCPYHLSRLRLHQCCALCGLFCTQGEGIVLCTGKEAEADERIAHLFHANCALDEIKMLPKSGLLPHEEDELMSRIACPHCGSSSDLKEISLKFNNEKSTFITKRESLLNKIADINGKSPKKGDTSGDCIIKYIEEITSKDIGYATVKARSILQRNPNPVTEEDFIKALEDGDLLNVTLVILPENTARRDINEPFAGRNGKVPLHLAVVLYSMPIIHSLILSGADSNIPDEEGTTPLMLSAILDQPNLLKYLIATGGDRFMVDCNGMNILHLACKEGNTETVRRILENYMDMIEITCNGGLTPIMVALKHGKESIVKLLFSYVKNGDVENRIINATDKKGNTLLHYTAMYNCIQIMADLLEEDAEKIHVGNSKGETPLHLAVKEGQDGAILALLHRGADPNKTDLDGKSVIDLANELKGNPGNNTGLGILELTVRMRDMLGVKQSVN